MPSVDVIQEGERIMTICNACRYCEGFCAVFPAMEQRRTFAEADMNYLANLCHNCTECLRACQYAAPHPFLVNVPKTLAAIRLRSVRTGTCWPQALGSSFRRQGAVTALSVAGVLTAAMIGATRVLGSPGLVVAGEHANFYGVVSHAVMVSTFGAVFLLVVAALVIGVTRYVNDAGSSEAAEPRSIAEGLRDAMSLKYLHGSGVECAIEQDARAPLRRWCHHFTFYGFLLCFASTTVAAVYHVILGQPAPYPFLSAPVILGTIGGIGLVVGPIGLWILRSRRDPETMDPEQKGLDRAFILLLVLTSVTGLALLVFRDSAAMGMLLIVHLAFVLTLFVSLPYGKFVHGLYRIAALIRCARESRATAPGDSTAG